MAKLPEEIVRVYFTREIDETRPTSKAVRHVHVTDSENNVLEQNISLYICRGDGQASKTETEMPVGAVVQPYPRTLETIIFNMNAPPQPHKKEFVEYLCTLAREDYDRKLKEIERIFEEADNRVLAALAPLKLPLLGIPSPAARLAHHLKTIIERKPKFY